MTTTNVQIQERCNRTHKNNLRYGRGLFWHLNGQLYWYSEFQNGERHGKVIWYNVDGTIHEEYLYVNGSKQ